MLWSSVLLEGASSPFGVGKGEDSTISAPICIQHCSLAVFFNNRHFFYFGLVGFGSSIEWQDVVRLSFSCACWLVVIPRDLVVEFVGVSLRGLAMQYLSPCGHRRNPMLRNKKMKTLFVANCVRAFEINDMSVPFEHVYSLRGVGGGFSSGASYRAQFGYSSKKRQNMATHTYNHVPFIEDIPLYTIPPHLLTLLPPLGLTF